MPHRVSETLQAPHLHRIRDLALTHTIPATLCAIGEERLAWLRALPRRWSEDDLSVTHAVPDDVWQTVPANAPDEELGRIYGVLRSKHVVYGHIHQPFVRRLPTFTMTNSGAVSLSYDGDRRAAYALIDGEHVEVRRVEYDRDRAESRQSTGPTSLSSSTGNSGRSVQSSTCFLLPRYMPVVRSGADQANAF